MKTPGDFRRYADDYALDEAVQNFLHCYGAPSYREKVYQAVIKRLAPDNKFITVLKQVIKEYMYGSEYTREQSQGSSQEVSND